MRETNTPDRSGERRCPLGRQGILVDFIRRARRRIIAILVFEQGVLALGAGFAGVALLLLLGTQLLDWYWPALLFGLGFIVGLIRLRKQVPSVYRTAQRIDARLRLLDTLSTAHYFNEGPATPAQEEIRRLQRESAEQLAERLSLTEAAPWRTPRSLYGTVALGLVACGMMGVRYGVTRSLDLEQPIAKFTFDTFRSPDQVAKVQEKERERKLDEQLQAMGLSVNEEQNQDKLSERAAKAENISTDGEKGTEQKVSPEQRQQQAVASEQTDAEQGEAKEGGENQQSNGSDQSGNTPSPQNGPQQDSPQQQEQSKQGGENSSLMEKMKNALANMLAKLKAQPKTGGSQQMASASKSSLQNGKQQRADQHGQPSPGKDGQRQQGQPSSEGKGNQESQGNQQAQAGQGQQGDQASDRPSNESAKTGMGKQDGNKDVKMAEQLAAMGKISEIIGKRNQSLTGEMMVEVASGKQSLKTEYTHRNAAHSEAGGEIHRDEVPIVLQQYVQQYFEEVRKRPLPPPEKASKASRESSGKAAAN